MKKVLCSIGIMVTFLLCSVMVNAAGTVTVNWENPTLYIDDSPIGVAEQDLLATEVELKEQSSTTWTLLGKAIGSAEQLSAQLPANITDGSVVNVRARSRVEGPTLAGEWSKYTDIVTATVPYSTTNCPGDIVIIIKR